MDFCQGIGYKQLLENNVLYTLDTCHMIKSLVANFNRVKLFKHHVATVHKVNLRP
jgi:hypothetical protein